MKIVQVSPYFESLGGTEIYLRALCNFLAAAGQEILLAQPGAATGPAPARVWGLPFQRFPLPAQPTVAETQGLIPARGSERLRAWLQDVRADVVHFHYLGLGAGVAELRAAKQAGARVLVTFHLPNLGWICLRGDLRERGRRICDGRALPRKCTACLAVTRGVPEPLAPLLAAAAAAWRLPAPSPGPLATLAGLPRAVSQRLEQQREAMRLADAVVVLAPWFASVLQRNHMPEDPIRVIPVGYVGEDLPAPRPFSPPALGEPLRVGFAGRLDRQKDPACLLRALRCLPATLPLRVEFFASTHSPEASTLLRELQALAANDPRVGFHLNLEHRALLAALQSLHLLCCPSRTVETGPMVALEAQAMGIPVVASDLPNLNALIEDGANGRLFPLGDHRRLAQILREIVDRPDRLASWSRRLPRPRTLEEVSAEYLALYQQSAAAAPGADVTSPS